MSTQMVTAAPTLFWFDRWDERKGILHLAGELAHTEELCGEDTLELACEEEPEKGDRLVWRDPDDGRWREHVVQRTVQALDAPCEVWAESSLCDLLDDYLVEVHLTEPSIASALQEVLKDTRWGYETTRSFGSRNMILYHTSVLAALRRLEGHFSMETEPLIEVAGGRVSARKVRMALCTGTATGLGMDAGLRLTYGKNMTGCTRTVLEDEVYTALYGWGAGLPVTDEEGAFTGGYRRKLSFAGFVLENLHDGKAYVANEEAREKYGLWNADRTERVHRFGEVTFGDIDNVVDLFMSTRAALRTMCEPKVTYEVDAELVEGGPYVGLGDTVSVVDAHREPAWRHQARCTRRVRTWGAGPPRARVTIGQPLERSWRAAERVREKADEAKEAAVAAGSVAVASSDGLAQVRAAAGAGSGQDVPALATRAYVDERLAELDDLSEKEF